MLQITKYLKILVYNIPLCVLQAHNNWGYNNNKKKISRCKNGPKLIFLL